MMRYNISASGEPKWRTCHRGMISISHGNRNLCGDKFNSLLEWASKRFKEVIINVSDTLYRHNLIAEGYSEALAESMSLRNGTIWIKEHQHLINPYNQRIIAFNRWDKWRQHSDFQMTMENLSLFYEHDDGLREAVANDCQGFLDRKISQGYTNLDPYRMGCTQYLLEELVAYNIMGWEYGANRIYPAKDLKCFEYIRSSPDIPELLQGLRQTTHIHVSYKKKNGAGTANDNVYES